MRKLSLLFTILAACHGSDPSTGGAGSASSTTTTPSTVQPPTGSGGGSAEAPPVATKEEPPPPPKKEEAPPPPPKLDGHDFTPEAKELLAVGACSPDGVVPETFSKKLLDKHCEGTKNDPGVKKAQQDYLANWVKPASEFFAAHVPKDIPKKVVYPFAGGDLSTALTVYPDADEITTISLEPAGDPRDLATLKGGELTTAMDKVNYELRFLYRVNFSNTLNMIDAMRSGVLPTEVIFALSALTMHGYSMQSLRYFSIQEDGTLHYLDDADIAKIPSSEKAKAESRNRAFANMEIQFKKGDGRIQVFRHIQQNLDDDHLKKTPGMMKYLEARGEKIAAMTKAASYLLSTDDFKTIRNYLTGHAVWMVSDATGIAPKWGKDAGFEYETYGAFVGAHIDIGKPISPDWKKEWEAEPKRDLPFRFGYYDRKNQNHMVIIKKKA